MMNDDEKEIVTKTQEMNEFDIKASGWDANPVHLQRSVAIAQMLTEMVPLTKDTRALELGAGTGLLSLLLKDRLKSVTMIDSSQEMIRIIDKKIAEQGITNMTTLVLDLEKEDMNGNYDIVYSQMVFHHVGDIDKILCKFYNLLEPGGYLGIADLFKEDGSFHDEHFTGHNGFEPDELMKMLKRNHFDDIRYQSCFVIKKPSENGSVTEYPVFLMTARKADS